MADRQKKLPIFLIGLTGIFGSGKSAARKLFELYGAKTVDCDALAREAYEIRNPLYQKIKKAFGLNQLARPAIAKLIFENQKKRKQLEALIHPYVFQRISEEIRKVKKGLVVIEIPLLFETGFEKCVHATVMVTAQKKMIKKRLSARGFSAREIDLRWKAQWPLKKKVSRADFIIDNSGSHAALKKQIAAFLKMVRKNRHD